MSRCAACLYLMTAFLGPVAFASESCPLGEVSCPAGATASGGCFNPSISSCQDGLICPTLLRICRRGSIGPGACFYAGQFICDLGRLRGLSALSLRTATFVKQIAAVTVSGATGCGPDRKAESRRFETNTVVTPRLRSGRWPGIPREGLLVCGAAEKPCSVGKPKSQRFPEIH